jgi:HK97 gp10 family phage protein
MGDAKLIRKLDSMGKKAVRMVRPAVRAALSPVNKAAKRNLNRHKRTGQLRKSLGIKVKQYRGAVWGAVGVRKGFNAIALFEDDQGNQRTEKVDPRKYAHLVEFGTRGNRGVRFLTKAWDYRRRLAERILGEKVRQNIAKEARKP